MIDYLLCFPDKETAIAFGVVAGYTNVNTVTGEAITETSSPLHDIDIIGEHFATTGNTMPSPFETIPAHTIEVEGNTIEVEEQTFEDVPEIAGDGKHWVLFRDVKGEIEVPNGASEYIVWSSDQSAPIPVDVPNRKFSGDNS